MKTIILLCLLTLTAYNVFGQENEKEAWLTTVTFLINRDTNSFILAENRCEEFGLMYFIQLSNNYNLNSFKSYLYSMIDMYPQFELSTSWANIKTIPHLHWTSVQIVNIFYILVFYDTTNNIVSISMVR